MKSLAPLLPRPRPTDTVGGARTKKRQEGGGREGSARGRETRSWGSKAGQTAKEAGEWIREQGRRREWKRHR